MAEYIEFNIRTNPDPTLGYPSQLGYKVLDGNKYNVWIRFNNTTDKWYLDLTSVSDSSISVKGIALLQGRDLLQSHGYGDILGELWVEDTAGTYEDPTFEGMGDRWRLRYYPRSS